MTSLRPIASSDTMPVSLLRISERKRSGTVVSASVPWMLRLSSDITGFYIARPAEVVTKRLDMIARLHIRSATLPSFPGVDYMDIDSLFSEEELMVRQTVRDFVDD